MTLIDAIMIRRSIPGDLFFSCRHPKSFKKITFAKVGPRALYLTAYVVNCVARIFLENSLSACQLS
jgi:hypothetical protein